MTFIDVGKTRTRKPTQRVKLSKNGPKFVCYQIGFTPQKGFNSQVYWPTYLWILTDRIQQNCCLHSMSVRHELSSSIFKIWSRSRKSHSEIPSLCLFMEELFLSNQAIRSLSPSQMHDTNFSVTGYILSSDILVFRVICNVPTCRRREQTEVIRKQFNALLHWWERNSP